MRFVIFYSFVVPKASAHTVETRMPKRRLARCAGDHKMVEFEPATPA
jgi:hypothetical protein